MGGNVIYNSLISKRSGLDRDWFGFGLLTHVPPLTIPIESLAWEHGLGMLLTHVLPLA